MSKLNNNPLPSYTRGEEIFNMVSHIAGGGLGIIALVLCMVVSALHDNGWGIVSGAVYCASMIAVYAVSSVYHGLKPCTAKKVMRIIDHCTIYLLIAGTYTPILLCAIRLSYPVLAWVIFAFVWGCAALGIVLNGVDMQKYKVFSMVCYMGMGWCIVFAGKAAIKSIPFAGLMWLLAGGIAYTVGAVLYGIGGKVRYMHSVFHLFVVAGSILQFICIINYIL